MVPFQHSIDTPYPVGPVHCYSTELAGELCLFDTGPPTPQARKYLHDAIDLERLRHVIVTHCHIDHYGLAHWLDSETGATVYLPYRDHLKISRHQERLQKMESLLREIGFSGDFLERFRVNMEDGSVFPKLPQNYRLIEEDLPDRLGLQMISCPGHSQSDLVFTGEGWAITGDVLLRDIFQTPLLDIDLLSGTRFNNYRAYCYSLPKLAALTPLRILPGHRQSISSVSECLCFYARKLLQRATRIGALPHTMPVMEILEQLFPDRFEHPFVSYLKASEIVFIRDFLQDPLPLRSALEEIGLFRVLEEDFSRACAA